MSPTGGSYPPAARTQRITGLPGAAGRMSAGLMGYLLGALTTLAIVVGAQFMFRSPDPSPIVLHTPPTILPTAAPSPSPSPLPSATPAPMIVFVSGAVLRPGLYQLPAEARIGDAVHMAGGLLPEANAAMVNQAERLWDGAQVHVPSLVEAQALAQPPAGLSGSHPPPIVTPDSRAVSMSLTGAINLNTATLEQLETLPGIGPAKGQAIIDGRPYATVDDLERVPGIGAATIAQLRDLVTTQ